MTPNEGADYWRYQVGVNVIPANSKDKIPLVEWKKDTRGNWQINPIPKSLHDEWKNDNKFSQGMAVICGKVFHNKEKDGLYLNGIDCDNKLGLDKMCPSGIDKIAQITIVEQHANKNKCHIYFYTKQPIESKPGNNDKDELGKPLPQIEIKSGGRFLLYCSPSIHKDGSRIEILGNRISKQVDKESLEYRINDVCDEYSIPYLSKQTMNQSQASDIIEKIAKGEYQKTPGSDRQKDLISYLTSKKVKNPELDEDDLFIMGKRFSQKHFTEQYDDDTLRQKVHASLGYGEQNIIENHTTVNIEESLEDTPKSKEVDVYDIAEQLMKQYSFLTMEGSKNKEIIVFVDGVFKQFGEDVISKRSRRLSKGVRNSHIAEIKGIIKDETGYHSRNIFDKKSYMITLKNKTVNLKTGDIMDHSPELLSRVKVPVYYDETATCPRFDKFLNASLDGDERKIRTILEMMALCFIKDNSLLEKGFMHTGKGSNGKSVLFGILTAMLGLENISAKTIHDFEHDTHSASSLEGVLANICADVGKKGLYETELLKKIISGDPIDSNRKFFDSYPFLPYSTLIFSANEVPTVEDESDAFARRFELIEWTKSFYGKDRDHTVKNIKNTPSELSGIFNKLIPITKELLQKQCLKFESTVEDAKIQWLMKSDSTQRFLDEKCFINSDEYCPVPVIFGNYNKFCQNNGMTPLDNRKFNDKLEKIGLIRKPKKVEGVVLKVWAGINLRSQLTKGNSTLA